MSQNIWDVIDPATTSGNQLATYLNNFKDAVISGMSGNSRPSEIDPGGSWVDTTNHAAGAGSWGLKIWTGTVDTLLFTINLSTNTITLPSSQNSFEIVKASDDALGPFLDLQKRRVAGGKQTLSGDNLGEFRASGVTDSSLDVVQAVISVTALESTKAANLGSRVDIKAASVGSAAVQNRISVVGDKVGVGISDPKAELDVKTEARFTQLSDDTVGPINTFSKKRINTNGKTLDLDTIGLTQYTGVDENGLDRVLASVEVTSDGDTNVADRGSIVSIKTVAAGGTALTEAIKIEKGKVYLYGVDQSADITYPQEALAAGAGNILLSIDGSIYKAFEATVFIAGVDSVEGDQGQYIAIRGMYNGTTWFSSHDGDILSGDYRTIDLVFSQVGETLTINYDNLLPNFSSGTITKQLRRL